MSHPVLNKSDMRLLRWLAGLTALLWLDVFQDRRVR